MLTDVAVSSTVSASSRTEPSTNVCWSLRIDSCQDPIPAHGLASGVITETLKACADAPMLEKTDNQPSERNNVTLVVTQMPSGRGDPRTVLINKSSEPVTCTLEERVAKWAWVVESDAILWCKKATTDDNKILLAWKAPTT